MSPLGRKIKSVGSLFWFDIDGEIVESKLMGSNKQKNTTMHLFENSKSLWVEDKSNLVYDISYGCELSRGNLIKGCISQLEKSNTVLNNKLSFNNAEINRLKGMLGGTIKETPRRVIDTSMYCR